MSYLLDLEYELNDSEFMEAFEFVYSTCEYSFEYITQGEMFDSLKSCVSIDKIKLILKKDYEITGNEITIYRGEADKSTHYKDGAISWTLDIKTDKFFANRFWAKNPKIYKATVSVNDILMVIDGESEILVESHNLKNVEEVNV